MIIVIVIDTGYGCVRERCDHLQVFSLSVVSGTRVCVGAFVVDTRQFDKSSTSLAQKARKV